MENREIKFRAFWNERIYEINFIDFKDNNIDLDVDGVATTMSMKFVDLMQYTGLKDKNGKEIYESDLFIVTYSDLPNGFEYFSSIRKKKFIDVYAEVVFHNGRWALKHKEPIDDDIVYGDLYKTLKDNPKEIQGNVYENPELLSKLKE